MKKLLFLLFASVCISAQAQDVIGKKAKKKTTKSRTEKQTSANYESPNGGMKVHEIDKREILDSTQRAEITAPHVNNNYNENQPALAPSNGNSK